MFEVSRSHHTTPHSLRLLWTREQPVERLLPVNGNRHASMSTASFELAIPGSELTQNIQEYT
jgi:hypothetical protein